MKNLLILVLSVLLASCALSPTGRAQLMLVTDEQAVLASEKAYAQAMESLQEAGKIDKDQTRIKRVQDIAARIIAQAIIQFPKIAGWDWSITVIDAPDSINAWCMAGGKIAVYTGLFNSITPTDDELAQVLGHEISHAVASHTAEKMSITLASQVGLTTVALVTGGNNGQNATLAGATLAAGLAIQLPNNRQAEAEADEIGIELSARAGFDPRAALTLWRKMIEARKDGLPEFLSTHPNPMSRISALEKLIPEMMVYYNESTSKQDSKSTR